MRPIAKRDAIRNRPEMHSKYASHFKKMSMKSRFKRGRSALRGKQLVQYIHYK